MKKREIALRLRRNIYGVNPREYDPNNGLVIHFEFMNGIPKKYDFIKSIFAIYARGEMLYTPKLLDGRKCEPDTVYSEKCVFDETFNIYDIPPFMDCMIIFEFQAHYDIGIDHSEKMEMLGWTVLDLFDFQRKLK